MARISTYANASPVALSDLLIGTSVGATPANATKNFLVSDLVALFDDQVSLQEVLDVGNTATQDLTLIGNLGVTGAITHSGAYGYSNGQFTMAATGTMVLGGPLTCNSSISLTGTVKDYNDTLGIAGQTLVSDGSSQVTWGEPTTGKLSLPVRYLENVTLGDPVYIAGYNSGQNIQEVRKADSADPNKMPAIGLADASYSQNTNGTAIMIGGIDTIDLSGIVPAPTVGSVLYVSNGGGGLVSVPPVGTSLIQNVGIVSKTGVSGEVEVTAIGRSNALPNITAGSIVFGQSTGEPVDSTLFYYTEEDVVQGATTFTGKTGVGTDLFNVSTLQTFASNAAALAADLVAGDFYKDSNDFVKVVV